MEEKPVCRVKKGDIVVATYNEVSKVTPDVYSIWLEANRTGHTVEVYESGKWTKFKQEIAELKAENEVLRDQNLAMNKREVELEEENKQLKQEVERLKGWLKEACERLEMTGYNKDILKALKQEG